MKKQLAISALLIFFFSQFGRVLNYAVCTISVYQHTNTFKCDCEKQLTTATDADTKKQAASHTVSPPQADELYHLSNTTAFHCHTFIPSVIYMSGNAECLYNGYYTTVFHPPGA
ncbi:MAG TPA: hypothetical protein VLD19_18075 [Chitinophagaceae bacterium]|nr:hypothetical protein [Chitinophagaceae bacterium]